MDRPAGGPGGADQSGPQRITADVSDKPKITEITLEREGPIAIIHVQGELDALAGPQLEGDANQAIESGVTHCIIDMTGASFIDSIGVGALIRAHRAANARGSVVCLAGPKGMIAQLIRVTQLNRIFPVYSTLDEARAAAAAGTAAPGQ